MIDFKDYYNKKIDENVLQSLASLPSNLIKKAGEGIQQGIGIMKLGAKEGKLQDTIKKIILGKQPDLFFGDKKEKEQYKEKEKQYKKPTLEQLGSVVKNLQRYTGYDKRPDKAVDYFLNLAKDPIYHNWAKTMLSPLLTNNIKPIDQNPLKGNTERPNTGNQQEPPKPNDANQQEAPKTTQDKEKEAALKTLSNLDINKLKELIKKQGLNLQLSSTEIDLKGLKYIIENLDK